MNTEDRRPRRRHRPRAARRRARHQARRPGHARARRSPPPPRLLHPKPAKKAKGVGFTIEGTTAATALPVADGALTGPLTLDPTSANKHARTLLTLTKADIAGTATEDVGVAGDAVEVKYVGLTATDALTATDIDQGRRQGRPLGQGQGEDARRRSTSARSS